ncbi:nitroreductase/quinone reductase family protein [Cellulosimicrobium marinum]|uniref:nitroreductase/quinone reductase family protein n=1 Tax=Cellulosimicrobium marinum TaxID=1638992 RepID=UPI001E4D9DEF|nr:nitroreductase/quinone reductase family protein [Cellulosimicrobium marinum]MCB7135959.1 nitroreductase family deazaflavin-dependent oxidoreductase [Cellulosimicrobium marinum]
MTTTGASPSTTRPVRRTPGVPALTRPARALAVASGAAGLAGGAALVGFFALADPWRTGGYGPWAWLGPANDTLGAAFAVALVPATVELAARSRGLLRWWGAATAAGLLALAVAGVLMVLGRVELSDQFVVSGVAMPLFVVWVGLLAVRGERAGLVGWATARLGTVAVVSAVAGVLLAVPAFALLPLGSPGQVVLLVPGVAAWVALSAWPAVLGLATSRTPPAGARRLADAVACRAYRLGRGRLAARRHGLPVLLLTTTGPTGRRRTVPVAHARDGAAFVVPACDVPPALPALPDWYDEALAVRDVRVEVGRDVLVARATALHGDDARRAHALLAARSPRLLHSWARSGTLVPFLRLDPQ